ncbi:MAG: substrate-binding domain-containing protein [Verrucomicrobia bacterium]|nr:substrate-binding domain-containing protein [Verrucomicrobiota bacterium]
MVSIHAPRRRKPAFHAETRKAQRGIRRKVGPPRHQDKLQRSARGFNPFPPPFPSPCPCPGRHKIPRLKSSRIFGNPAWAPDAIYCAGDLLALGAVRALRERGLRVPKDVSVVGAAGVDLSGTLCPRLTATRQPLEQIGEELLAMLCQRIEQGGAAVTGRILPMPFTGGGTTRPEENVLLGISNQ